MWNPKSATASLSNNARNIKRQTFDCKRMRETKHKNIFTNAANAFYLLYILLPKKFNLRKMEPSKSDEIKMTLSEVKFYKVSFSREIHAFDLWFSLEY